MKALLSVWAIVTFGVAVALTVLHVAPLSDQTPTSHALLVALAALVGSYIARSFFQNVIGLDRLVGQRRTELDARGQEMALVFDHVQQGFLTSSADGRIITQHSRTLDTWFSAPEAGDAVWHYFARFDLNFGTWLSKSWPLLSQSDAPREVAVAQLPNRFISRGRSFEVIWQPVEQNGQLTQMLAVVSDITERLEREAAEMVQREMMQMFDRIMRDRSAFLDFLADARDQVSRLEAPGEADDLAQLRVMHTVRDNCALFGMISVSHVCQQVEAAIIERRSGVRAADRQLICEAFQAASLRVLRFLGDEYRPHIELDPDDEAALVSAIKSGAPPAQLLALINSWKDEPLKRRLERFAEQASSLAERMGKGTIEVDVETPDLRLSRDRYSRVWSSVVHLVRNAVDHGLRVGDATHVPRLQLTAREQGERVVLTVADNGRGIDWVRVAQIARARGLPTETPTDLEAALFADGVSAGHGLSAARNACRELGGDVAVSSSTEAGTTIELSFTHRNAAA